MGRIEGSIGIGAALLELVPLAHVARLFANGRYFVVDVCSGAASILTVLAWTGDRSGERSCIGAEWVGTAGEESRMMDFLNHDGLLEFAGLSVESLCDLPSMLECFFPRRRAVADFGRKGSTASVKYSCFIASADVGRFRGSHIRHHVTKLLSAMGHCGGRRIVSIEWGAIWIVLGKVVECWRHSQMDIPLGTKTQAFERVEYRLSNHRHQLYCLSCRTNYQEIP